MLLCFGSQVWSDAVAASTAASSSSVTSADQKQKPGSSLAAKAAARIERQLISLTIHLSRCLFNENDEIVLEAARALGKRYRYSFVHS